MENKVKPITPDQAIEKHVKSIPDFVIESVNELISEKLSTETRYATILQKDIVERIISKSDVDKSEIFRNHWLDIEEIYRNAGWDVEYDSPAYCEHYDASFTFTIKN